MRDAIDNDKERFGGGSGETSRSFCVHIPHAREPERVCTRRCLTASRLCSIEQARPNRLQNALAALADSMREVNSAIEEMRSEHDPLASHIFISRRHYQNMSDTKSGKRHDLSARLSWQQARDLGFRGDLAEWERLLGAAPTRE